MPEDIDLARKEVLEVIVFPVFLVDYDRILLRSFFWWQLLGVSMFRPGLRLLLFPLRILPRHK